MSEAPEEGPHKAVMVLEYTDPHYDIFFEVMDRIREILNETNRTRPTMIHVGIRETAEQVLEVFSTPETQPHKEKRRGPGKAW